MPRRRPGSLRAVVPPRRPPRVRRPPPARPSGRARAETAPTGRQRPDPYPGAVAEALGWWSAFVRMPRRRPWDSAAGGPLDDPRHARSLLDAVARSMTPHRAREPRRLLRESDELY